MDERSQGPIGGYLSFKAETVHMCCRVQIFTAMRAVLSVCGTLFGKPMVYWYRRALFVSYGHPVLTPLLGGTQGCCHACTQAADKFGDRMLFGTEPDMPDNSGAALLHGYKMLNP